MSNDEALYVKFQQEHNLYQKDENQKINCDKLNNDVFL